MNTNPDAKHLDFPHALFYLRLYYKKLLEILEVFCGQGSHILFRNGQLNGIYTILKSLVEEILGRKDFREFAKDAPHLFESLIGDIEEMDMEWEFLSRGAHAFNGKIEKEYLLSGSHNFDVPEWKELSKQIDKVMVTHQKNQKQLFAKLMETAKRYKHPEKLETHPRQDGYEIAVKDREIWVNKYLIGKPHAVGNNFEFFEYIRSQKPNTKINREALPNFGGNLSLKEQVKSKSFIKIVNELGFKGEILKAFFYNRGKDTLTYRGDQITKEDLEKAGVKKSLFLKELELAHARNSPE